MGEWAASFLLLGALSTGGTLPFWSSANQYGIYPESNGALAVAGVRKDFNFDKAFDWRCGGSVALRSDGLKPGLTPCSEVLADELYASLRWKKLVLDLGMKHNELDFLAADARLGSLSTTGGRLVRGSNARAMPGYAFVCRPVAFPFTKEHLWFFGSFEDYMTLDRRYVDRTLVHRMNLGLKIRFARWMELTLSIDHYALWGGWMPGQTRSSVSFANYFRVITGQAGGADASQNDRMNVLGCHGGSELIRFDFHGNGWDIVFQHDRPYNDKSGMKFQNFPDAVNTLSFSFRDKKRWVSDVLYEFTYTMFQSGPIHDPEVDENGNPIPWDPSRNYIGLDDYFNSGEYKSGWTYYGRPMTSPLFYPAGMKSGTWSRHQALVGGVENNRLMAHHIAISGMLFRAAPYKLMLTFSQNYGTYGMQYAGENASKKPWGSVKETPLLQFSAAFTGIVPDIGGVTGFSLLYGIYGDIGQVLKNNFALTLGLRYQL